MGSCQQEWAWAWADLRSFYWTTLSSHLPILLVRAHHPSRGWVLHFLACSLLLWPYLVHVSINHLVGPPRGKQSSVDVYLVPHQANTSGLAFILLARSAHDLFRPCTEVPAPWVACTIRNIRPLSYPSPVGAGAGRKTEKLCS
jgi:hypothetical protein